MDGGGPKTNIENNEVARNSIWREHVRKEDSLYRAPAPFRVDPKTIRPMPEKPNRTDPNTAHQVGREDVPLSLRETVPSRTTPPPTHRARQMDLNNDGTITEEEMRKYNEMYAAMSSANRAPRGTSSQARRRARDNRRARARG